MRYRLGTLLIVLALGPAVLYGGYRIAERYAYYVYAECRPALPPDALGIDVGDSSPSSP